MNDEIKEILEEMKSIIDTGKDINGIKVDGCGFHGRDLKLLYDYITNLQEENEKLKKELNDISNISYKDYSVWATERRYLDTLDEFANDIKYKIAPNLTDSYRDGIKSALKHTIKYVKDNYKQETLEDYKSRVEKAIEQAKEKIKRYESYINDLKKGNYPSPTIRQERQELIFRIREQEDLLNILQNGSENQ